MPFNGSGVFQRVRNWVADATAGIKVRADYHDAEDDGFAEGISNCIAKDGQTIITQNIPFNSKRATGLADPVNPQDASTKNYTDTKLPLAGGAPLTGNMEIEKDGPALVLDDTGDAGASIQGLKDGELRWLIQLGNGVAESGGNAGSNFTVNRYDDAGVYLGMPLSIERSNGHVTVVGDLTTSRSSNEGVVFLGTDGVHYVHYTGTNYAMPNGKLILGGAGASGLDAVTWDQLATKQPNLGFTPIQQGGGAGMMDNKIYIGWNNSQLICQVDGVPQGAFTFAGSGVITGVRLGPIADYNHTNAGMQEPFPGACMVGMQYVAGNGLIARYRAIQVSIAGGGWATIGG